MNPSPGPGRRVVASLWTASAMPFLVLSLWVPPARAQGLLGAISIPWLVALSVLAGLALGWAWRGLSSRLPSELDDWLAPSNRKRVAVWALGGLFALFSLGRMAVFLADPGEVSCSLDPEQPFLVHHSCLTAYVHGAILSTDPTANVYDLAYVEEAADTPPPLPPTAARFAPFTLDAYGYPPPFLLLPRALLRVTDSFFSQRLLFASGSLALFLLACASAARVLGGVAGRRMWLLTPLFLASPLLLVTLQVGNFHLATVALCVLTWVALERRRDALTGTLLAAATLAKMFPGLLGVVLLMQRRFRAVGYTAVAAAIIGALSVAVLGTRVWSDFLFYHLPNVQSGDALRFMAGTTREIAFNVAPFGIPFKLGALGLGDWGWPEARLFGNVYTVIVCLLAVLAGRNQGSARHRLTVWSAVLLLASLRSPNAPPFVLTTLLVLLLALAGEVRSTRGALAFAGVFAVFTLPVPITDPAGQVGLSLVRALALYAFLVWAALRRDPGVDADVEGHRASPTSVDEGPGALGDAVARPGGTVGAAPRIG